MTAGSIDLFPLALSLRVAVLATALAVVTGVPVAWMLARGQFAARDILAALIMLPMLLPPTVLGYYLLLLVGRAGPIGRLLEAVLGVQLVFSWPAAVLAAWVAATPFLVRAAQASFEGVDPTFEQTARTLGRSEVSIFFTVTVPLAWKGIVAGVALCFARAIGEFGVTLMIAGNIPGQTQTMAVAIYDAVQAGRLTQANVMAALQTLTAVVILSLLATVARATRW
ncbi:MAG: molybdate ABC transporter permease subunit [Chloroflexota bacterium]